MIAVIRVEQRKIRAMSRVPTRFPADQWPGEPLMETGRTGTCAWCKAVVDLCDLSDGWCVECEVKATHPVHGWMQR